MTKKKIHRLLAVLLAAVLLFGAVMLLRQQALYQSIASDAADAARVAGFPERATSEPPRPDGFQEPDNTPEETPEHPSEEMAALAGIDLAALRAVNGDVAGWIEIPGTELSYPLLQGVDNQYYLSRNWKGEPSGGGSIYLESTCRRDLTGFHLIVYGHRMNNDSMFGILKYYSDLDFWREHPSVYLAMEDEVRRYDIFAAQEAEVRGIVYRLDLEESQLKEEFLQFCVDNSVIDTGITPEAGTQILTLSTCTSSGHVRRWVVHGVLAEEYSGECSR